MRILIADDDKAWVRVVTRYFSESGHKIFSSDTWSGAQALAGAEVPDVILMDGALPDGEPADFCAAIRAMAPLSRTALLVVSGEELEAGKLGADGFIFKGGSLAELETAINSVLAKVRVGNSGS